MSVISDLWRSTKEAMAKDLFGKLSKWRKVFLIAGGTAVVCGIAYVGWKALRRKQLENKDEGFVDVPKVGLSPRYIN